jgi:hypothetical protein
VVHSQVDKVLVYDGVAAEAAEIGQAKHPAGNRVLNVNRYTMRVRHTERFPIRVHVMRATFVDDVVFGREVHACTLVCLVEAEISRWTMAL